MNLLFIGDIIGRPGRDVVTAHLPRLRDTLKLDFVLWLRRGHDLHRQSLGRPEGNLCADRGR
jgi:hypothetical protein